MFELDPAWIALIGTIFGGILLKVTEHWLGKNKIKIDDAAQIRGELRDQVTSQKEEIRQLEDEIEEWRSKYYDLRDELTKTKTELQLALDQIKRLLGELPKPIP